MRATDPVCRAGTCRETHGAPTPARDTHTLAHPTPDPVGTDLMDVPRVVGRLLADWDRPVESYNRLTAFTLATLLKPRMAAHDEGKHDGSVDLLVSGCEVHHHTPGPSPALGHYHPWASHHPWAR